jgi:hypothetical protein
MRLATALLAGVIGSTPASAQVLEWQMNASEDQVNNFAGNPDGSTDSTATGTAAITYDVATGMLTWDVSWSGLTDLLSALHIHGPANPSRSSMTHLFDVFAVEQDVIDAGVDRTTGSTQGGEPLVDIVTRTSIPPVDPGVALSYIYRDLAYVNVHSLLFPMGEIRANFVRTAGTLPNTRTQAKCADANNKNLAKIAKKRAKELGKCVRDATKGKLAGTAEGCVTADPGRPVDKATDKTRRDFQKKCWGFDRDGVPNFPLFAAAEHAQVSAAGVGEEIRILRWLFGNDLDAVLQTADEGRCQAAVVKQAQKCEAAKLKEWNARKKAGRKAGIFTGDADVEACFGADPKGKVAKTCDQKLRDVIARKCPADVTALFVSVAAGPVDNLVTITNVTLDCQHCRMLNRADALALDCELLDDGAANGTCPLDPATFL